MEMIECRLIVFFEAPYWVGFLEKSADGQLMVCKQVFGAEPRDPEVYEWILQAWNQLHFSPPVSADAHRNTHVNPKRMQREAKRQIAAQGVGTRSQQALQLLREENKLRRRQIGRQEKEREAQRRFDIRQQRRKEKHRGR